MREINVPSSGKAEPSFVPQGEEPPALHLAGKRDKRSHGMNSTLRNNDPENGESTS